jgi:hypothetical protein
VNLNAPEGNGADADGDDIAMTGIEQFQLVADPILASSGGDDQILANGGVEFTGPLPTRGQMVGGIGNDILAASTGGTAIEGDEGDDTMTGGPGDDGFHLILGDDVAAGAGGTDTCSYLNSGTDLHVDLRTTAQQNVGAGELDTLSGCEDLGGGDEDDTLIGTNGPNVIDGGENSGEPGADTIFALGGKDTVFGREGADTLRIRDGGPDTVSCGDPTPGPPPDKVTADQRGVDAIDADCELIDFLPAPPAAAPPDETAPDTVIDKGPKRKTSKRKAKVEFHSTQAGSSFECKLDRKDFAPCESPFRKKVERRRHSFHVRSIDDAGNVDPTPALHKWKVKKKR